VTRAEEFEELRPLLFAIAYRILGSVSEAEDAVQETWLRYEASPTRPTSTKAFLSAVVTRVSINVLSRYTSPHVACAAVDVPELGRHHLLRVRPGLVPACGPNPTLTAERCPWWLAQPG
jgi:DNA-directed RNA polymerase specialized sigma24 family protein